MTPKEKAKELEELFTFNCRECDNSKISVLIAVDEILSLLWSVKTDVEYWQKVKQEIEKL
jgi:hypothetical protein